MCERCFSGKPVKGKETRLDISPHKVVTAAQNIHPIVAFHGRRVTDDLGFFRMVMPIRYGASHGMKHKTIRHFGHHPLQSVNPLYWQQSLRLHDLLIRVACSQPQPFTGHEITGMIDGDKSARMSAPSICEHMPARLKVLRCVAAGAQDSCEIAAMTGIPKNAVSAWMSVLCQSGEIERIGQARLDKVGGATFLYQLPQPQRGVIAG